MTNPYNEDAFVMPRRRRLWPVFVAPGLLLVAAAAWSGFWFVAAGKVDQSVDEWRAREAAAGRVYDCAKRSVAGYPFRLEVRCEGASVTLRGQTADQAAAQAPVTAKLGEILVIAQVYDPTRLIAEFKAPATLTDSTQHPLMVVNWTGARSSIVGLPGVPQRVSLTFDNPAIDRINGAVQVGVVRAKHAELHGRFAESSTPEKPVIDAVVQTTGASIQEVHPVLLAPFDTDIRARLTGLRDFAAKPWPERLREIQANGGRIEITQSRIQQGQLLAVGAGSLGLSASGRLDGEMQMTVAGIEAIVPALGIDKLLESGVQQETLDKFAPGVRAQDVNSVIGALDKMIPGLSRVARQNANVGVAAGINSLGTEAELEGRKARSFPLRFVDGAVFLGTLKVAQTPPLY
ncbi:MAG: hypothetical protein JWR29_1924 [Tardiphaga sp.]|nr:hypothetical protein [Tardiphaga sp.]